MAQQKVDAAKRVVHLKRPSTNLSQQGAPPIAASFHTTTSQTSSHQNFPKAQNGAKVDASLNSVSDFVSVPSYHQQLN